MGTQNRVLKMETTVQKYSIEAVNFVFFFSAKLHFMSPNYTDSIIFTSAVANSETTSFDVHNFSAVYKRRNSSQNCFIWCMSFKEPATFINADP